MAITKVSRGLLNTGVSDSSDSLAITITNDENVLIGTTSGSDPLVVSDSGANSITARFINTNADANPANIRLQKNSSSPADGDYLGMINVSGNIETGAEAIFQSIDFISSDVSDGTEDGDIVFRTRADGTLAERLRIAGPNIGIGDSTPSANLEIAGSSNSTYLIVGGDDATNLRALKFTSSASPSFNGAHHTIDAISTHGNIAFAVTGSEKARITNSGLTFNGDTAASNALNDYEEGTWSPTITTESGASGQAYDRQYGFYTRIGDFVFLTFDVRITTVGTFSGSYLNLGGHGFTFEATNAGGMGLCGWFGSILNLTTNQVNFYANDGNIFLMQGGNSYLTPSGNHITSNSRLIGGFCGQINR